MKENNNNEEQVHCYAPSKYNKNTPNRDHTEGFLNTCSANL